MTKLKHYYLLFIVPLLIIACSSGNNGTLNNSPANNSYTFKSLIAQNNMAYTPPPAEVCPGTVIVRDDPSLTPSPPNCGTSTLPLTGNWCMNNLSPYSYSLSLSVVGVEIYNPSLPGSSQPEWDLSCNGTIIDKQWVITAAHCIPHGASQTRPGLFINSNIYVVPWQSNSQQGIPSKVTTNDNTEKYEVENVFVSNQIFLQESDYLIYPNFQSSDFALLKLKKPLPSNYLPLKLESQIPNTLNETLWSAAYKKTESSVATFGFRNVFYQGNTMFNKRSKLDENVGQLYTLGSIPATYGYIHYPYAWSFMSAEDAGGPLITVSADRMNAMLVGIAGTGTYCNYPGFFAPDFMADYANLSIPVYYNQIKQIIDYNSHLPQASCSIDPGSGLPSCSSIQSPAITPCAVQPESGNSPVCIVIESPVCQSGNTNPACSLSQEPSKSRFVYVLDKSGDMVISYKQNNDNTLTYISKTQTGFSPVKLTLSPDNSWILVANSKFHTDTGSISIYKRNPDGTLTAHNPAQFNIGINNPVDVKFYTKDKVYVINDGNNSVLILNFVNGNLTKAYQHETEKQPTSINFNIKKNAAYIANYADNSISVYKVGIPSGDLKLNSTITNIDNPTEVLGYSNNLFTINNPLYNAYLNQYTFSGNESELVYAFKSRLKLSDAPTRMALKLNDTYSEKTNGFLYMATLNPQLNIYQIQDDTIIPLDNVTAPCSQQYGITLDKPGKYLYVTCSSPETAITVYKVLTKAPWLQLVNNPTIVGSGNLVDIAVATKYW